eukprot:s1865_g13.t1
MSLGSLPSMMSGRVCAVEYDDEAFACESIEGLSKLYKSRILQDRAKKQAEDVLLAGRSMGALLACMIALQLQKEQIRCSVVILDSEVVWPSKLDNSFCYDWLGGEVEATFWLSRLAGAKEFVEEQVQSAVTRGHLFDEGASRLQTAAFGQIASNLTAFGFRNICTLASSNCARLRQLLRPTSGSMRAPSGIFDGKVLIVAGEERGQKLRQVASNHCRNISMCTVSTEEVYVGEAATAIANEISWFLRSRSQDRRRKPGPEATPVGKSAREEEALVSLEEISTATYLVPGPDGGILGEMSNLAEALSCDCYLDFDEEACRYSTLPDDLVHATQRKVVLVGHRSGATLAYEMAMQLQNIEIDVRLVIIQGEVSMGSQNWLGSTCEATLALAHRLGAKDFALQEAASMAAARKEKLKLSKGRLQTRCGLAFDGISGGSLNGHPKNGVSPDDDSNKLLMKAFWKVSDQLNGMSVEGFKGLIQDIASRMDWYMNLGSGNDFAFDGPALLILGDGEAPEDADAMIESNALYCTNLEVADVSGDEHSCLNDDNIRMLADQIISWQEKQVPSLMNGEVDQ